VFFAQEEGPTLVATAQALFPRWAPFILTGLLAGLRWGESAALYRTDIDSTRGRLHVQRTFSEKANSIQPCKDGDDRWVKASPALLAALRGHLAADGPRGSGQGVDPRATAAGVPDHRRAHHPLRPVPRERLAAAPRQGRTSLPEVPLDASHLRNVALERRG